MATSIQPTVPAPSGVAEKMLTAIVAILALLNVAPLLAWVSGLGSFADWFRFVTIPALVGVIAIAVAAQLIPSFERLRLAIVMGSVGGLLGTVAYDVVRVPFVLFGRQVLAPIESYGVLLLDAEASSGATGFAGWAYHFANGVCFGIAFATIALGRSKWWAVGWSLVLETATVVTAFAVYYNLTGKWDVIAIAYFAHVPYGLVLGWFTEDPYRARSKLDEVGRWTVPAMFAALAIFLVVWHRPSGTSAQPGMIDAEGTRFMPRWTRVAEDTCATVHNLNDEAMLITGPDVEPLIEAGASAEVCFAEAGVHRLRVEGEAWSGGFMIVDPELAP